MSRPTYDELAAMLRQLVFQTGGYLCQECGEWVHPAYPLKKHASSCRIGKLLARLDEPEPPAD